MDFLAGTLKRLIWYLGIIPILGMIFWSIHWFLGVLSIVLLFTVETEDW